MRGRRRPVTPGSSDGNRRVYVLCFAFAPPQVTQRGLPCLSDGATRCAEGVYKNSASTAFTSLSTIISQWVRRHPSTPIYAASRSPAIPCLASCFRPIDIPGMRRRPPLSALSPPRSTSRPPPCSAWSCEAKPAASLSELTLAIQGCGLPRLTELRWSHRSGRSMCSRRCVLCVADEVRNSSKFEIPSPDARSSDTSTLRNPRPLMPSERQVANGQCFLQALSMRSG